MFEELVLDGEVLNLRFGRSCFTQKTQQYSSQLKSYEKLNGLAGWLGKLHEDPTKWARFTKYLENGDSPQEAAAKAQSQTAGEPPEISTLKNELENVKAGIEAEKEYNAFRRTHQNLSDDDVRGVVQAVTDADERGEYWTLEMAYRWLWHEKGAAKAAQDGQQKAEDAMKKGQAARTLGSVPTSAQATQKKEKNFFALRGASSERQRLNEELDRLGVKFTED